VTALAIYIAFLVYAVARLLRAPARDEADYIVAGRRLTLPAFVATMVATWYGGILGVGEYAWRHGVSNWLVFGVPYYLYAVVFALFLAGRARRSDVLTLPDLLHRRYGRTAALLGAVVLLVTTVPAAYVLMLGVLVRLAVGWPLWIGVVLGTLLSVGYVFRGGLRGVVVTDQVQFLLMFAAFLVLVPTCVVRYGGWSFLQSHLPPRHLTWDGGLGVQAVLVWYVIAAGTLVDPAFYQRCYAAGSARIARRGLLLSVGFWIVFDALTTTAGLYARAVLPDLADPVAAFPRLGTTVLGPLAQGLFLTGLLATIMSTVDSNAFVAAVTWGRDIVQRWRDPEALLADAGRSGRRAVPAAIPVALAIVAGLSIGLALAAGSVITLWHHLGSVAAPTLLWPVLLAHTRRRLAPRAAVAAMLAGGGVALLWLVLGGGGRYLGWEPVFPGLAAGGVVVLADLGRQATGS